MAGFTATSFVRMLRRKRNAAAAHLNLTRASQEKSAFLVQQAVAALEAWDDALAEAIKLQNAVIAEAPFVIQQDGSVRVDAPRGASVVLGQNGQVNPGDRPEQSALSWADEHAGEDA